VCHQRQPLLDGLRHQEPVEGITVVFWQAGETQRVGNGDWELVEVCGAGPRATMSMSALRARSPQRRLPMPGSHR